MLLSFMIVIVNIIIIINFILISITLVIMIIIITNMSSGTFIVILNHDQYEYERLILLLLSSACLWTFTALKGIFRSPYYPRKYNNKASCTWHIIVPWNYTISLTFKDFSTEERCCTCDYVEVWETHKNGSTVLMQRFCDDKKPLLSKPFYSSGNNVTVFFHSDDTKNAKGFEAIYEAIPVNGKKRPSVASRCVNSAVMSVIKELNAFGTAKCL